MVFMKKYLLIVATLLGSCTQNYRIESRALTISDSSLHLSQQEKASALLKRIQAYEYSKWENCVQKIRNAYTNVIKVIDDKESIQFSVAFFKVLSISEDFEKRVFYLSQGSNDLPNIDVLKFLYKSEKELDEILNSLRPFTSSSNEKISRCAQQAEGYFQFQRDLFIAIREVDYRKLHSNNIPDAIPPEVLRANARMLEQRDQMSKTLIEFYNSFGI